MARCLHGGALRHAMIFTFRGTRKQARFLRYKDALNTLTAGFVYTNGYVHQNRPYTQSDPGDAKKQQKRGNPI
jgi:hypothetical protein